TASKSRRVTGSPCSTPRAISTSSSSNARTNSTRRARTTATSPLPAACTSASARISRGANCAFCSTNGSTASPSLSVSSKAPTRPLFPACSRSATCRSSGTPGPLLEDYPMAYLKYDDAIYVGGEWQKTDQREAVINPADESLLIEAPVGSSAQVEAAIGAARTAFDKGDWPQLPVAERQAVLTRFLNAVEGRKTEIVDMIVAEAGATRMLADFLQYGIPMKHARRTVELAARAPVTSLPVELTPNAQGRTTLGTGVVSREPVGVVAAISPYNFPFFLNIGKVIPALAVGCTAVLKPSPYTPMQALILGEIADEVGLPKGVLSIVTGDV